MTLQTRTAARTSRKRSSRSRSAAAAAGPTTVVTWPDDPISKLPPIAVPVPNPAKAPLRFKIKGPAVPAGTYPSGTAQFRYWNAAAALRRACDFWGPLLGVTGWQPGSVLPIGLDEGVDLNAYYDRSELAFFHDRAGSTTVFSCESPDVVCHELGHAVLDAHRPELWDAPYVEAAAFHESFGDMSAILAALQLPTVRAVALPGIAKRRASQLSRLAEQLGWAIRQVAPTAVNRDCLRNACNAFKYVDPETLPDRAPATQLSAEVHSFSRVFTGAFYDILGAMLRGRASKPGDADLVAVARDAARLLIDATHAAPVEPDYFAQVASHMIDADAARFSGKYRSALVSTFLKRRLIPAHAVSGATAANGKVTRALAASAAAHIERPAKPRIYTVSLSGADVGLPAQTILVRAPVEQKRFTVVSAAIAHREDRIAPRVEAAAQRFVRMLVDHRRIDTSPAPKTARAMATNAQTPRPRVTHALVEAAQGLRLVRKRFDCRFGC